jgi:hypothetical protein
MRIRKGMRVRPRQHEDDCMSGTNQRTWQTYHLGHFSLTIQLDPVADGESLGDQNNLANVTRQLASLLEAHRMPATWAVSDPAHSAATSLIIRSSVEHELAILGDANWLGPSAGRTRFARELARRTAQARSSGLEVTTLVPRVATIEQHIDLVVKHRITAVAGIVAPAHAPRQATMPRALHYGVWELPVTGLLPVKSSWWSNGGWSTWRRIRRAMRDAAAYQLLIDAPSIAQSSHQAEKTIAWLIRRIAKLRDRGLIRVETLRAAAARLADVPAASPQRSILRRAA